MSTLGVLSRLYMVPFADLRMHEEKEETWGEYSVFGGVLSVYLERTV